MHLDEIAVVQQGDSRPLSRGKEGMILAEGDAIAGYFGACVMKPVVVRGGLVHLDNIVVVVDCDLGIDAVIPRLSTVARIPHDVEVARCRSLQMPEARVTSLLHIGF